MYFCPPVTNTVCVCVCVFTTLLLCSTDFSGIFSLRAYNNIDNNDV